MVLPLSSLACGGAGGHYPDDDDEEQPPIDCAELHPESPPEAPPVPVATVQQALRRATFTGIGDLPGGDFMSEAHDVDAAGQRVVGIATGAAGWQGVIWTEADGLVALPAESTSAARGISDSGCVVVGSARTSRSPRESERTVAARWVGSAPAEFAPQPLGMFDFSEAVAVSGDGGTIVARASAANSSTGFVWRGDELSNDSPYNSSNLAVNEDGSVVVGRTSPSRSGGPTFALRNGEPLPYPFVPECSDSSCAVCITPGECIAVAQGVSADGNIVVGFAVNEGANEPSVAVQWTLQGEAVTATVLSTASAAARAVSADGRIVVGSEAEAGASVATLWLDGQAARIEALLESEGLSVEGWQLTSATSVSADGQAIVGTGINPDGNTEGWLARLPLR